MKYLIVVVLLILTIATTGCDAFKRGFDEGYSGGGTEEVE
jgi:hypothetical protein